MAKTLRMIAIGAITCMSIGAASPQQANFGTAVAECHGEYDYANLLAPSATGAGHDTRGITLFGSPVKTLTSSYSNEYDEESYSYASYVDVDYATLRRKALAFHGAAACAQEVATPGSRHCAIDIAKPRSGKKFAVVVMTIYEHAPGAEARCTLNL